MELTAPYCRNRIKSMYRRLFSIPDRKKSFFLFGPRATGKTTWIKAHTESAVYIDLLKSDDLLRFSSHPSHLEKLIPPDYSGWIIIDEIQKVPQLLDEVHRLIESRRVSFILTGSSARSLRRKGVNLLAGRALTRHMFPLTAIELGEDFSLEQSIRYGHLPAVFSEPDKSAYLRSYVSTYLKEEVLQEGLTRNIGAFSRFLETASFSHGSLITYTEIAREMGLNRKVVENYFGILEDLLLSVQLPVFVKRAKRRITAHPKFYFFDTGVYQALRPRGPLDSYTEVSGPAVEGLFLQDAMAVNSYLQLGYQFYFWRTSSGREVDFILYGPGGLKAFELKHTDKIRTGDMKGLAAFKADYPEAETFLIYTGERTEYHGGITVLPLSRALKHMDSLLKGDMSP
jgi:predicted AAA+ superfamily ATPase